MQNNTYIDINQTEYEEVVVDDNKNKELIRNVVHTTMLIGFVFAFMSLLIILLSFLYLIKMRQEGRDEEIIFRIMGRGDINYLEVNEDKQVSECSIDATEAGDSSNNQTSASVPMKDQVVNSLTMV